MAGDEPPVYVLALAEPPLPARMRLLGRPLRVLTFGPVAVVTSTVPRRSPPTSADLQQQHALVEQLALRVASVLPARFGAAMTTDALRALVSAHEASLAAALALVRGRVQMTLRMYGAAEAAWPGPARSSGSAYLESLRDRARHHPPEVAALRGALGPWTSAERVEPADGPQRLTIFHLVARADVNAYRTRADALARELDPVRLRVSGPWAPFAFAPELI